MKCMLGLNLGAMILLTFAVGCGGNSSDGGSGGTSSTGGASSNSAGSSAVPGGGASSSAGQTSNPGSAGAPPGGGFMTSVPGSTPLKDLTPAQLTQLCADLQKYLQASFTQSLAAFECKALALTAAAVTSSDAEAQATCKSSLAQCTPTPTTDSGMCDSNTPATCTATVADATTCINDQTTLFAGLGAALPGCDGLTVAKAQTALAAIAADGNGPTSPASCTKYQAECGDM